MNVGAWFPRAAAIAVCCVITACAAQSQGAAGGPPTASAPANRQVLPLHVSLGHFADPYGVATDPRCHSNCEIYVVVRTIKVPAAAVRDTRKRTRPAS
jgi:hypothetical protein